MSETYFLTLTLACHSHNGFGVSGGAGFISKKELNEHWYSIPDDIHQEEAEFEWNGDRFTFSVDLNGEDETNILDDKWVTKELAMKVTGLELEVLVKKALDELRKVQPDSFESFSSYRSSHKKAV